MSVCLGVDMMEENKNINRRLVDVRSTSIQQKATGD